VTEFQPCNLAHFWTDRINPEWKITTNALTQIINWQKLRKTFNKESLVFNSYMIMATKTRNRQKPYVTVRWKNSENKTEQATAVNILASACVYNLTMLSNFLTTIATMNPPTHARTRSKTKSVRTIFDKGPEMNTEVQLSDTDAKCHVWY